MVPAVESARNTETKVMAIFPTITGEDAGRWCPDGRGHGSHVPQEEASVKRAKIQMRDLEGFAETRQSLLHLKPNNRNNWIAFAVSQHLNGSLDVAAKILEAYESTLDGVPPTERYEHGEMILYKSEILEEDGKLQESLDNIDRNREQIVDLLSADETSARLLQKVGKLDESQKQYRSLLKRNPDNHRYHFGLHEAMELAAAPGGHTDAQSAKLKELYEGLSAEHKKSSAAQRIPLTFLKGEAFLEAAEAYTYTRLKRGIPSLFADLSELYTDSSKAAAMEALMEGAASQLAKDQTFPFAHPPKPGPPATQPPDLLLWVYFFLAQHYDMRGNPVKAIESIDKAIAHSPTIVDLYLCKARIMGRAGDRQAAWALADEARSMDLADRYLNSECVKVMLQGDQVEKAQETIALFTKEGDDGNTLYDMQEDTGHTWSGKTYDVCIIGGGPHALAVLSALFTPTSILTEAQSLTVATAYKRFNNYEKRDISVCVVDPSGRWLNNWDARFHALNITFLRSPLIAHPDMFNAQALLVYAEEQGRLDEIKKLDLSCSCLKGQQDLDVGLYNLPSTALFRDFCRHLAGKLPHDFVAAKVESVKKLPGTDGYTLDIGGGQPPVNAQKVVCALGFPGQPNIPSHFEQLSRAPVIHGSCLYHTSHCEKFEQISKGDRVLVVGGGLSAAQAALMAVRKGAARTVLCSRRPLTTRHFDVPLEWVNPRKNRKTRFDYFSLAPQEKLDWIKNVRQGGSIPPDYMSQLLGAQKEGKLELIVDDIEGVETKGDDASQADSARTALHVKASSYGPIDATHVILATGCTTKCMTVPLCKYLVEEFDLPVESGLPVLSNDLQWGEEDIYVVGALAMMQLGPDAANLMGARRGAQICASEIGTYDRLNEEGNIQCNRYACLTCE